jgi:class I fructose-bisphosphate aldolase
MQKITHNKFMIEKILSYYESENPGTKAKLFHILQTGRLAGTGKLIILPVDQGFEHGADRSFLGNQEAYDPHYHFKLAVEGGFNAYAAPLGMLEAGADTFAGRIPLILKLNSSNTLTPIQSTPDQAITASVSDALRLGCSAVGFTIYPGSSNAYNMFEEIKDIVKEAKSKGLAVVIWSYARGSDIAKEDEVALDVISYAAHIASLLGANIVKVKPPSNKVAKQEVKNLYEKHSLDYSTLDKRVAIVKRSCFNGRRLVVFSGGEAKDDISIYNEIAQIAKGGGDGSIVGRNMFQRKFSEAILMSKKISEIYKKI